MPSLKMSNVICEGYNLQYICVGFFCTCVDRIGSTVTIGGTVCENPSISTTQITCRTGQRTTTIMTKVRVATGNDGIAFQVSWSFFFVLQNAYLETQIKVLQTLNYYSR